jgi:hypothetical protein
MNRMGIRRFDEGPELEVPRILGRLLATLSRSMLRAVLKDAVHLFVPHLFVPEFF